MSQKPQLFLKVHFHTKSSNNVHSVTQRHEYVEVPHNMSEQELYNQTTKELLLHINEKGQNYITEENLESTEVVQASKEYVDEYTAKERSFNRLLIKNAQTYSFIYDEEQLLTFYRCFVREIAENCRNETSIKVFLQSRRKYNSEYHQTKATVTLSRRHFELHQRAEDFVKFIRRFEIANGLYADRKDGQDHALYADSMVLYATSNALSRVEATKKVIKGVVNDNLFEPPKQNVTKKDEKSDETDDNHEDETCFMSLDKVFLTALHQSPVTKIQRFDVDTQEPSFIARLDNLLVEEKADVIFIIKTRSGYHYVIKSGPFMRKMYEFIAKHEKEISGDKNGMNCLPGTLQGGKRVQLIFAKGEKNYYQFPSLLRKHAATAEAQDEVQS